jgi:hypothetical protein
VGCKRTQKFYLNGTKQFVRVVKGIQNRVSCRSLFLELNILTVTSLYIFDILWFKIKNKIYTTQYSDVHGYNTIHKHNLYVQICNTEHNKSGVISMGTNLFNGLPLELKD